MADALDALLEQMVKLDASDLFLKVGSPPSMRRVGAVASDGAAPVAEAQMRAFFERCTDERSRGIFEQRGEVDIVYEVAGLGRFRGNLFRQRGYIGMVFRAIKSRVPSMEELRLPAAPLQRLAQQPRGLILVTGVAGSGKSTTIAAMIEHLNHTSPKHIVTIEDPIEYTFKDDKCVIDQREVGYDTESFSAALKSVVRQSPDVIMIGELRDRDTMDAAFHAAETGHLVFSTLHSTNAMQTVDRMINFFEPHEHAFLQLQMSLLLEGVVSQRLLPRVDGTGRVAVVELMLATPTVRELLLAGKTRELYNAVKEGGFFGCRTFNQSLRSLLDEGLIHLEDALAAADSPEELKLELRGISKDLKNLNPNEMPAADRGGPSQLQRKIKRI
jgi:twitching motility protein PilT